MTEPQPTNDFDHYEEYTYNEYSDLAEYVDIFDSAQEHLSNCIELAMSGQGGATFMNARNMVRTARNNYIESVEELSAVIFDQIEQTEAVKIWATLMHFGQEALDNTLTYFEPMSGFGPADMKELQVDALTILEGRKRKQQDRADDDFYVTREEVDEDSEKEIEHDQYGDWVLREYASDVQKHIDRLLMTCPPGLYPVEE